MALPDDDYTADYVTYGINVGGEAWQAIGTSMSFPVSSPDATAAFEALQPYLEAALSSMKASFDLNEIGGMTIGRSLQGSRDYGPII